MLNGAQNLVLLMHSVRPLVLHALARLRRSTRRGG
jgi:hypothetical protein